MFKVMASGMEDCAKTKEDWIKFLDMISIFKSPASFAFHVGKDLLVNGKDIYADIESALTEYKGSDWYHFGYHCGNAAAKTFLGAEEMKAATLNACDGLSESSCKSNHICSWCECSAVPSSCKTVADARNLPASIFDCSNLGAEKFIF